MGQSKAQAGWAKGADWAGLNRLLPESRAERESGTKSGTLKL